MADTTNLDDLLNFDEEEPTTPEAVAEPAEAAVEEAPAAKRTRGPNKPKPVVDEAPAAPVETAEQARIRELQAELSKPVLIPTEDEEGHPLPENVLTPEQRQIRELEDKIAKRDADILEKSPDVYDTTEGEESILIHVLVDGFTAQGRVWFVGQEIEFVVGSKAYKDTLDRFGNSWLDKSEEDQAKSISGIVYFRKGPWPGKGYDLDEAAAAERKRNRKAPILTS